MNIVKPLKIDIEYLLEVALEKLGDKNTVFFASIGAKTVLAYAPIKRKWSNKQR